MKKFNFKIFIISILIVFAVGGIGSIFTIYETSGSWYKTIRPSITPPNFIFPIVWNILFFLIGISLYLCWANSKNAKTKKKVAIIFGINFLLNILWSFFYFHLHNPLLAFVDIIFLEISILSLIFVGYKINHKAGYLLAPYFLWVVFASVLNYLSLIK